MATKRIAEEPAYVLHRYDWSESSLILEVFTRHHGRIALVAKGAKRPSSSFRPVLLPLQLLQLTFGGEAEIRSLKHAEWQGGHVMPTGEALLAGYYLNELILALVARDDPHPGLFDIYVQAVQILASEHGEALQACLRSFELLLLREIGVLPSLDIQTMTLVPLDAAQRYVLVAEGGLRLATPEERSALTGSQWAMLQQGLLEQSNYTSTLRACAAVQAELKPMLRALVQYHCGVKTLRTRQMMMDIQSL